MESLDDSLIEAAYDLGANKSQSGGRSSSLMRCWICRGDRRLHDRLGSYLTPKLMGGRTPYGSPNRSTTSLSLILTGTRDQPSGFSSAPLVGIIWTALKLTRQKLSDVLK